MEILSPAKSRPVGEDRTGVDGTDCQDHRCSWEAGDADGRRPVLRGPISKLTEVVVTPTEDFGATDTTGVCCSGGHSLKRTWHPGGSQAVYQRPVSELAR